MNLTLIFYRLWYDPLLFNYFIMTIYGGAILWTFFRGHYGMSAYWSCALGLTLIITMGWNKQS